MAAATQPEKAWWKEAVVYQIYPASFQDSNGDGWGDIPGIIRRVPHIKSLGVNTIWLSPIYKSPQKDMGYDVSDYRSIHEPYGTLDDMQKLIDVLHANQIKVLMDLVVNHTSDQHEWFLESKSSKTNAKRDYYFWRDPKYDANGVRREPNNWKSIFGGSAWHFDEATEQYYLALFLPSQPDLNWENAEMRQAAYDDMRFWLDRGVDGFRIDSMNLMSKHPDLPDGKVVNDEPYQSGAEFFASGPKMHEYVREMREQVFDKYDAMTVGELGFTKTPEDVAKYVSNERHELHILFTGDIVDMDFGTGTKYGRDDFHPRKIRAITDLWQQVMPRVNGWNTVYLDNHDSGRSLTRYASDKPEHRAAAAKMLATYLVTLSGTLFLLAGQEMGMANLGSDYGIDAYTDVEGRNHYNAVLKTRGGDASQMADVMRELQLKARDHGRLPVQWDEAPNAGFTDANVTPWMTINKDHKQWNIASQVDDPDSVLSFWKTALALRKEYIDLFVYGEYTPLPAADIGEMIVGYERKNHASGERAVILLNFSGSPQKVNVSQYQDWRVLLSNQAVHVDGGRLELQPFGGCVLHKTA